MKGAAILAIACSAGLCACSTVRFYRQAIGGQMEILGKARRVESVLADPATAPALAGRLRLAGEIRAFAGSDLHLPVGGQYGRYAALGRPYVVWVVFAAPELSLEAHEWWYPFLGRLEYRGFFNEQMARDEATALARRRLDVHVAEVEAYSTLGWFRDPLLDTFIHHDDSELAELLIHELTHRRAYLPGDTDFNEAFATANAREGVRRWLGARGRTADLDRYRRECRIEDECVAMIRETRRELEGIFGRKDMPKEETRAAKKAAYARLDRRLEALGRRHHGSMSLDRWFEQPVNNARLNSVSAYHELLPAFDALLASCRGDLREFHRRVASMRRLGKKDRLRALDAVRPGKGGLSNLSS